jgi:AraC family transcriptional regulator
MPSAHPPILPRVLPGGAVIALSEEALARASILGSWEGIRAIQLQLDGSETPPGPLVNNLVSMNLGGDTVCGINVEGRGWESYPDPHYGLTVIPAHLPHVARGTTPGEFLLVELEPDFVAGVIGAGPAPSALPMVLGARDPFAEHVLLAIAEQARRGAGSAAVARGLGTALVTHLSERRAAATAALATPPAPSALPSPTLGRVLEYVARHLDTPLSLERLAAVAGMDLFRFARAFKQSTGSSPHRYLLEARIVRAKELLRDRALPITEIALQTGFATPSHFSVTFRRITGVTPRAFRDGQR